MTNQVAQSAEPADVRGPAWEINWLQGHDSADSYTLGCRCSNCGWRGLIRLARGQRRPTPYGSTPCCPVCGCGTVEVSASRTVPW